METTSALAVGTIVSVGKTGVERAVRDNDIKVLNVIGPSASQEPGIGASIQQVLEKTFNSSSVESRDPGTSRAQPADVEQPILQTTRLLLRPLTLNDAPTIATLGGRREVADTSISVPHPYSAQQARVWISRSIKDWDLRKKVAFAVVTSIDNQLVGVVELLDIDQEHGQAEMEFWIGVDWWGRLYATEAAQALLQFGFEALKLNRIYACHMLRHSASGRVLKKIGMTQEGVLRERVHRWGVFEDLAILSVLRKECRGREKSS